jgi:hypothetical protein
MEECHISSGNTINAKDWRQGKLTHKYSLDSLARHPIVGVGLHFGSVYDCLDVVLRIHYGGYRTFQPLFVASGIC